jgi:hypothetical protein
MQTLTPRIAALLLLAAFSGGCRSASIDGEYLPGCLAFAGDSMRLDDGVFTWDRFTDQVSVDANGNVIDPFPAHPLRGRFELVGSVVSYSAVGGTLPPFIRWIDVDGVHYLLREHEFRSWQDDGTLPPCALVIQDTPSN